MTRPCLGTDSTLSLGADSTLFECRLNLDSGPLNSTWICVDSTRSGLGRLGLGPTRLDLGLD